MKIYSDIVWAAAEAFGLLDHPASAESIRTGRGWAPDLSHDPGAYPRPFRLALHGREGAAGCGWGHSPREALLSALVDALERERARPTAAMPTPIRPGGGFGRTGAALGGACGD